MNKELKVKIRNGYLIATISEDPYYPGIDIEYVSDDDIGEQLSRPRVLVEWPHDDVLRALIWNDPSDEDYTQEIVLMKQEE